MQEIYAHDALYLSTCNALLFLRLICPAVISPIECGVLRKVFLKECIDKTQSKNLDIYVNLPTLCLLSHILADIPDINALFDEDEIVCILELSHISYAKV